MLAAVDALHDLLRETAEAGACLSLTLALSLSLSPAVSLSL